MTRQSNLVQTLEASKFFKRISRYLLMLLTFVILAALFGGIVKTAIDLEYLLHEELEVALRRIIIDVLILLAVVEIYKTTFTYFSEGRVRVTYIVDTVLVVMLAEIISSWFREDGRERFLILIGVMFSLITVRILAIYFRPKDGGGD